MKRELPKTYDPSDFEGRIYQSWCDQGLFTPKIDHSKPHYSIVIPPPNITGQLHMGHALDNTLQDILIRYKRMKGFSTLWLPGTDHASIATEAKIVEAMRKEGLTKEDLGRDGFLTRASTVGKESSTGVPTAKPPSPMRKWTTKNRRAISGTSGILWLAAADMWKLLPPVPKPCWVIPPLP